MTIENIDQAQQARLYSAAVDTLFTDPDRFYKSPGTVSIGLEAEFRLADAKGLTFPAPELARNAVIKGQAYAHPELGAAQIEIETDPIYVTEQNGWAGLYEQYAKRFHAIMLAARERNLSILRHGSSPLTDTTNIEITEAYRASDIPAYLNVRRVIERPNLGDVEGFDCQITALSNALQINIEAHNAEDAVDKLNRSLCIGPLLSALFANARIYGGHDTGYADARMQLWEMATDTRTGDELLRGVNSRVGLPRDYYESLRDYFKRVGAYEFLTSDTDNIVQKAIGKNWRDARIKIMGDSLVVEFRPLSIQATVDDDMAATAFFTGRLLWSQQQNEPLLPFKFVKENRRRAMRFGMNAKLFVLDQGSIVEMSAAEVLKNEIEKTRTGLEIAGIYDDQARALLDRAEWLVDYPAPSDRLVEATRAFERVGVLNPLQQALYAADALYLPNLNSDNRPTACIGQ